jgi:hypothetical protein
VVGNTDVGVDLYCESIIEGDTFLHFWVQVKSSENLPNHPEKFNFPFATSSLKYWAKQPVPVLALLVPVKWPPEDIGVIHVVDVTFGILENGIKADQKEQSLETNPELCLPISKKDELASQLEKLLLHHLPMIVSAMYAEKGFIYPAPKPTEQYTKYFSGHFLPRHIHLIEERARHAATFGIMQWIDSGNEVDKLPRILVSGLEAIQDDPHYEVHEALGVLCQSRRDLQGAREHFETAKKRITGDPTIDHNNPPWVEIMQRLNTRIKSIVR